MQYFGGKQRIAGRLAEFMAPMIAERGVYVEPFVGGASVMARVACPLRVGADANEALITLWKWLQRGWVPPDALPESLYAEIKNHRDPEDPLTAFAGFGCSFAGKWFGGYCRNAEQKNYAGAAKRALLKKMATMGDVVFKHADYTELPYPRNAVIYCDPPYAGTTQYGAVGHFDSNHFWAVVRGLELKGHPVFVSEYTAPSDFDVVLEIPTKTSIRDASGHVIPRVEKLFRWRDAWINER